MRFSGSTALLALAGVVSGAALPIDGTVAALAKRAVTDGDILQFALTLEHLENAFYKQALSKWPRSEYLEAGFSARLYDQLKYVAHDEEGHVVYLEAGLKAAGLAPVKACTYSFPMGSPKDFVALASVVEGVGVSAYLGAAPSIMSKAYLTAAGSILVVEAVHNSALRNANKEIPMANVFGTPLGINAVYSIASAFIVDCPKDNAPLPVKAYDSLTLKSGLPTAESADIKLVPKTMPTGDYYVTFVSGLDIIAVKPSSSKDGVISADVPTAASGQSYVFITKDGSGVVDDTTVLFGPAIIEVTPASPTFDLSIM